MLEKLLQELIAALTANTAALKGAAVAPAAEPKKGKTDKAATVTQEAPPLACPTVAEVRAAAQELLDAVLAAKGDTSADGEHAGVLKKLATKHGVAKISEVPEAVRESVIKEIKATTEKAKAAAAKPAAVDI